MDPNFQGANEWTDDLRDMNRLLSVYPLMDRVGPFLEKIGQIAADTQKRNIVDGFAGGFHDPRIDVARVVINRMFTQPPIAPQPQSAPAPQPAIPPSPQQSLPGAGVSPVGPIGGAGGTPAGPTNPGQGS